MAAVSVRKMRAPMASARAPRSMAASSSDQGADADQHRQAAGGRRFVAVHPCPITSTSDPRYPLCNPGSSEYNLLTGGNASTGAGALKPEESKQATLGFRLEPAAGLSIGFDFWDVKLTNQIQMVQSARAGLALVEQAARASG